MKPLTSISEQTADVKVLLRAAELCRGVWWTLDKFRSMRRLGQMEVEELFGEQGEAIRDLLLVHSPEELMELLDSDEDGYLNETEQLLLFSLVKERMQSTADDLCAARQYSNYDLLLREIEVMEKLVLSYTEAMRQRIYDEEIKTQSEFHYTKLKTLRRNWDQKLKKTKDVTVEKLQELQREHRRQLRLLDDTFDFTKAERRIKPRDAFLRLQNEERMAAVTGNLNEAKYVRKKLTKAEAEESMRVNQELSRQLQAQARALRMKQVLEYETAKQRAEQSLEMLQLKISSERVRAHREVDNSLSSLRKQHTHGHHASRKLLEAHAALRRHKFQAQGINHALDDYRKYSSTNTSIERSQLSLSSAVSSYTTKSTHPLRELKARVPDVKLQKDVERVEAVESRTRMFRKWPSFPQSIAGLYDENLQLVDESIR